MAAVFSRRSMRVRCATQRDHVFHPEMNYSQTQLDQLDRLTERWVADHLQKGKTSKENKELVTLEKQLSKGSDGWIGYEKTSRNRRYGVSYRRVRTLTA